jgi:RNA polymerase sigma-70 factor (ECF subfamily)
VQLAYRFVWNRVDAEDAVHNALAIAHEKGGQLREGDRWWSWVARIVVRQCLLLRRSDRRRVRREQVAGGERPSSVAAGASDLERGERADTVRHAIAQLPPQQRAAITLRHLEEMSYRRIAEILEISESTARVHVRQGREALRKTIAREHGEADTR